MGAPVPAAEQSSCSAATPDMAALYTLELSLLLDMGQAGAFIQRLAHLTSSHPEVMQHAARALFELFTAWRRDKVQCMLEAPGVVAALVPLLESADPHLLRLAAQVFDRLSVSPAIRNPASKVGVQDLVAGLVVLVCNTSSPMARAAAAGSISKLTWHRSTRSWLGGEEGLVTGLVALLTTTRSKKCGTNSYVQLSAAQALRDLARGAANAQAMMWTPGCIAELVYLLDGAAEAAVQQAAVGAVYRLTHYAPSCRASMAEMPGMAAGLMAVMRDPSSTAAAKQWAAGAIADMATEPAMRRQLGRQPHLLDCLTTLLWRGGSAEVERLAAKALRSLAAAAVNARAMAAKRDCILGLVLLLDGGAGAKAQEHAAAALYYVAALAGDARASLVAYPCLVEAMQQVTRHSSSSSSSRSLLKAQWWASAALQELGVMSAQQVTDPAGRPHRRQANPTPSPAAAAAAGDDVFQTLQRPVEAFAAAVQSAQQRLAVLAVPGGRVVPHTAMAGQLLQQLNALVPLMSDGASVAVARQVNQDRPPVTVRVDVHAQRTAQAVNRVTEALMGLHHFQHLGMPITLEIITGRGNNSAGGVAAVRGAVKRHLQQAGIPYSVPPHNSGVVHVAAADMPPGWYPGAPCQVQR